MRRFVFLAVLAALASEPAVAQNPTTESRRAKGCDECPRDSSLRVMHMYRLRHRDDVERLSRLSRDLAVARRALDGGHELSAAQRRRLERRVSSLESQIASVGASFGLEAAGHVLKDMGPVVAEAQRAMADAMAQAGVAAAGAMANEGRRFQGWIGITLDAPSATETRGGDVYWRFYNHPEIVSVEPSSPAESAGIRQGDVLIAYDGQDVRREIAMNRLLQPGRTVRIRVRTGRENEIRDVPVKVARMRDQVWRDWARGVAAARPTKPRSPRAPRDAWTVVVPEPPSVAIAGEPPVQPAPVITSARFSGLAGAHMETITRGLGEAIGVERGVLVISVPPGGPAYEAGLTDGDVIVKADGRDAHSVQELRKLVAGSGGRAVKLDVVRKGKVRQVTLRW